MTPLLTNGPNIAFLHHQHGPLWNIALPKPLADLGRFLERKIYPNFYRSTPIVTLSESSRSELSSVLRLNQENIHVVEPGVSPSFHSSSNKSEDPLVVVAGRLSPYKQIDRVIKAVNNVRTVIPNVKLEIIGEGPDESNLRTVISSLPDSSWILLRGRVAEKDLIETYQRAWVVSSASLSEGWGMTLTEGARCGTASVASNIPGHTDAVSHGVSGYLFDNDEEYEEHLISLLSSRNNAISLGESALQWSSHFTWEKAATESFRVLASTKKNNA
jgi:glycosyltransferase involved in cell wall biosynthesis